MKSFFFILTLATLLMASAYSSTEYIVTGNDINIRADSTVLATSLGKLSQDDWVTVLNQRYEWSKIILPKHIFGYVWAEYVNQDLQTRGKVTVNALNVRHLPSLQSDVIGKIYLGDEVEILEKDDQWLKIKVFPNAFGWVHNKFLTKASKTQNFEPNYNSSTIKLSEIKKIDKEISLTSFVANIVPRLSISNMKKKELLHKELIGKGEYVIPVLEPYLPSADKNTTFSIIYIFSNLGKENPILVSYFLKKINTSNTSLSSAYLDIVQNILQPKNLKTPYSCKATEGNLPANEIIKAKQKFEDMYQDKLIQDIKDSL